MRRIACTLVGVTLFAAWSVARVQTQTPAAPLFIDSRVGHVGVLVHDADAAAKAYGDLFGVPVAPPREVEQDRARLKVARVQLSNVQIELIEPTIGPAPWRAHLERVGDGLHHVAFDVQDVDEAVAHLVRLGGTHQLGAAGDASAYVDMTATLGFTIELTRRPTPPPAGAPSRVSIQPAAAEPSRFAMGPILHVGIIVPDVVESAGLFADLLGVTGLVFSGSPGLLFPPGFTGDPDAHARSIVFPMRPLGIKLSEPQGGASLWRDHLDRFGASMHHLAVRVRSIERDVAYLTEQGGTVTLGPGPDYAFVDLKPRPLGFTFELNSP